MATGLTIPAAAAAQCGGLYPCTQQHIQLDLASHIKASNTEAGDGFGSSIACPAMARWLGCPGEDGATRGGSGDPVTTNNAAPDTGALYVFLAVQAAHRLDAGLHQNLEHGYALLP